MVDSEGWREDGASAGDDTPDETSTAQERAGYARSAVRERADRVKQRAREKGSELKESAQQKATELKEQAERRTDELTSRIGGRVSVLARALRRAGDELRVEGESRFAELTDQAADQVDRMGSYLDGKNPGQMTGDLERMARSNPAFFVGGTFALGLLVGRFLRSGEPGPQVAFEPEGDWGIGGNGGPSGEGRYGPDGERDSELDFEGGFDETILDEPRPERAMTPDIENISAERPSTPAPGGPREHLGEETPARSAFAGHETRGPGVRTGSSGAAALDAGSAGPRLGQRDALPTRRREPGQEES